jgi:hypothetical protein
LSSSMEEEEDAAARFIQMTKIVMRESTTYVAFSEGIVVE